jgi:cobalt-zinc-cadmium resistance protein CzcA
VLGAPLMLAGENSRLVARRVAKKLAELPPSSRPGSTITTVYDRTDLVDRTIATVEKNLFEGAILVVVVLLGLLGNWRAALIVALAIPLSFLFAITGMVRFGISGNLMSLGRGGLRPHHRRRGRDGREHRAPDSASASTSWAA